MDYFALDRLRRTHPGWRLLTADNAPLVVSFLNRTFVEPNVRTLAQGEIASRLDGYLHHLRRSLGEDAFPRKATQYLDDWTTNERGWLRKYYPPDSDEPQFDLSPATEATIRWIASLGKRAFVGTESRLMTVIELLRQIAEGTERDPGGRVAGLEKRRAQIDAEIARIRAGRVDMMDPTQVKDRFLQMADTARGLLSDFRAVEQNLRDLDRSMRERIATWDGGKGALLEEILGERDAIADSDQGRSFRAFWDFLMSPARQDELTTLLEAVFALDAVRQLSPDRRLLRIHFDWLEAGEVTQRTVARLSEQLRRYLDDKAILENRRIMELLRELEHLAVAVRSAAPEGSFMALDEPAPSIDLSMERPLFAPPLKPRIASQIVLEGDQAISADALFEQVYVDKARLSAQIRRALQTRSQISLAELIDAHPLEQGLGELVAYLSLAADEKTAVIDDTNTQRFSWSDDAGRTRRATLPLVIFSR